MRIYFKIIFFVFVLSACKEETVNNYITPTEEVESETGSIELITEPANAEIYVDDNFFGYTPDTVKNLDYGNHTFLLLLDSFEDTTFTYYFDDNFLVKKHIVLENFFEYSFTYGFGGTSTGIIIFFYFQSVVENYTVDSIVVISPGKKYLFILDEVVFTPSNVLRIPSVSTGIYFYDRGEYIFKLFGKRGSESVDSPYYKFVVRENVYW